MHVHPDGTDCGGAGVITVAGKQQPSFDKGGTYRKACALLASDLGWQLHEVYALWRYVAMLREYEQSWPRGVAEWRAMHDVRSMLAKHGQEGD